MSHAKSLEPAVSIGTAYQVSEFLQPITNFNQALQPTCSQSGTDQTATPLPSPSR